MCGAKAKKKKNMRCVTLLLKIEYEAQKFIGVTTRPEAFLHLYGSVLRVRTRTVFCMAWLDHSTTKEGRLVSPKVKQQLFDFYKSLLCLIFISFSRFGSLRSETGYALSSLALN